MAKLTRIVKKVLSKDSYSTKVKENGSNNESIASKGKAQPMIDFSNLPILAKATAATTPITKKTSIKTHRKAIVKENRKQTSDKRAKLKQALKTKYSHATIETKSEPSAKLNVPLPVNDSCDDDSEPESFGKSEKSTEKQLRRVNASRGIRKRQARKEMWRRKHQFQEEAKRLVEQFQKEDKFGKALGNFTNMSKLPNVNDGGGREAPFPLPKPSWNLLQVLSGNRG
ncbi:hypothetical protein BdWA1_001461 [Babesia duncani]|uniref:Ribosome biogenesis protein SLX9 n=1 Tax=Babesia duncani TaxID=323732 RepID=A0AAD9UQU0_9APIC|nr:hypothetical protein BdWA1_001461 [Babesia duncani]